MKEVVRADDPRLSALIARQATQHADDDQIGLDRIRALLDALGRPQDRLPPVFHVAGTNGKGSTCAFLRAGLEAAGQPRPCLHQPAPGPLQRAHPACGDADQRRPIGDVMARVLDANDAVGGSLFEVNTAAAMLAFADTAADAVVLEVGLGGRLDATNVVERPLVTGIASIGLDHQHFLGDTLGAIAAEKAGIARRVCR